MSDMTTFKREVTLTIKDMELDSALANRMRSVVVAAVVKNPELISADRQTFWAAVRQCASHGLVPDGNEATLQTYNTKLTRDGKEQWVKAVQYQPMIRGITSRVLRSGKIEVFYAEVVYEGESFMINMEQGDRRPKHEGINWFDRGEKIVGAYAVAKYANGSVDCEPLQMKDIEKIRGVAKTQKVWDTWFSEKAKVAAMRRLSKRLPLAAEDHEMIINADEHDFALRDVTPAPRPAFKEMLSSDEVPQLEKSPEEVMAAAKARTQELIDSVASEVEDEK